MDFNKSKIQIKKIGYLKDISDPLQANFSYVSNSNNENIINCPECGVSLDIDNVLFHQLEEKAKKSLQDEYNAKIKDLKNLEVLICS